METVTNTIRIYSRRTAIRPPRPGRVLRNRRPGHTCLSRPPGPKFQPNENERPDAPVCRGTVTSSRRANRGPAPPTSPAGRQAAPSQVPDSAASLRARTRSPPLRARDPVRHSGRPGGRRTFTRFAPGAPIQPRRTGRPKLGGPDDWPPPPLPSRRV